MNTVLFWFAGIWPIVGHYSFWVFAMAACAAVVWFRPTLFKPACWVAAVITAGTVCYAFGVHDGEKRVRAQCDAEKQYAIDKAKNARARAQRDLARKPSRWLPNNPTRDPDCRDC